ncbi:MAG: site-2 protease family protein [Thermaerobacter sp.]|nr:site-2 protease family protein [Thermaerobacter sp.]
MPIIPQSPTRRGQLLLTPDDPRWSMLLQRFPGCGLLTGTWYIQPEALGSDWTVLMPLVPDVFYQSYLEALLFPGMAAPEILTAVQHHSLIFVTPQWTAIYEPVDATPAAPARTSRLRKFGTLIVGAAIKFKALIMLGSLFFTMLVYGMVFGWKFAVGLVLLIAIHESGHVWANRRRGIPATLPIFIPFLGALIQLKQFPKNAADEAFIGIMGPVFGLGATLAATLLAFLTNSPAMLAIASVGFLIHVFNLMPVLPLDGGRTVGFWRWKAWIPGIVGAFTILFYNPVTNRFQIDPVMLLIVVLIIASLAREPGRHGADYTAIATRTKWGFTVLWLACLALSIGGYIGLGQLHPFG